MKVLTPKSIIVTLSFLIGISITATAQDKEAMDELSVKQKNIIKMAALTSHGDLPKLKPALQAGLDSGITVNEIKDVIVHLYAYCGFPRSIRGLQTFMEVLNERKAKGIIDNIGAEASTVDSHNPKYERGKQTLAVLTKTPQDTPLTGYAAFAPVIDTFLKEHLFADIFERDVLSYAERELVTISVLSSIGGVEPMLESHFKLSLNVGISPNQLQQFVAVIKSTIGDAQAKAAQKVLDRLLSKK